MNARARKKRQKVKVEGLLSLVPEEEGKRQGERERKERFFCLPFVGERRSKSTRANPHSFRPFSRVPSMQEHAEGFPDEARGAIGIKRPEEQRRRKSRNRCFRSRATAASHSSLFCVLLSLSLTLQQERLPGRALGEPRLKRPALAGKDQGGKPRDLGRGEFDLLGVGVIGLLERGPLPPRVGRPGGEVVGRLCEGHGRRLRDGPEGGRRAERAGGAGRRAARRRRADGCL